MHDDDRHVCYVSRRQRLRWRCDATCCMLLLRGLFFCFWRRDDMRGHERVVCVLHGWIRVLWRLCCSCGMHVCRGLLFECWCCKYVRGHNNIVHFLLGREVLHRQRCPASRVHVYGRVRLDERDIGWVYGDDGDLRDVPRWLLVRWWRDAALILHLQRWAFLGCWCRDCVRWHNGFVCDLHSWQRLWRECGSTDAVFAHESS